MIGLLATGCQEGGSSNSASDSPVTDSIMYYLGQIDGAEYLQQIPQDPSLKEATTKEAYIAGVRAGLAALKPGDDDYNNGVMMGSQMASSMLSYAQQMDMPVADKPYVNSLDSTITAGTIPNVQLAQAQINRLLESLQNDSTKTVKLTAQMGLKEAAQAAGLPKIDDDLYGMATTNDSTAMLNYGDDVKAEVQITQIGGEVVKVPMATTGKIGTKADFPSIVSNAMLNFNSGESGEFMTTAHALLGSAKAQKMGLKPSDVLQIKVTATLIPHEEHKKDK